MAGPRRFEFVVINSFAILLICSHKVLGYLSNESPDLLHFSPQHEYHHHTKSGNARTSNSIIRGGQSETEYFDLSYTLDKDNIFYPGQRFDFHLLKDVGPTINETLDGSYRYSYASWSLCMSEHGGTHMDAPFHFNKFGWRLSEIPLNRLVDVPLVVVDVEHLVFSLQRPDSFGLEIEHILDHESKFGKIPLGAVVIVKYGWGKFWPDKQKYSGFDNSTGLANPLNYPGMLPKTASWLVRERQIIGVGSDTMGTEVGNWQEPIVHVILLENQVYIIENVAYLDNLLRKTRSHGYHQSISSCSELRLSVLPIKTLGTGGPVRLIAHCRKW